MLLQVEQRQSRGLEHFAMWTPANATIAACFNLEDRELLASGLAML